MSATSAIAPRQVAAIRRHLLDWYDKSVRPLPWRRDRDPYRVWIAETMLQQTRIAVVIPAYERFLAAFPDLAALSESPEEVVLSHWSGLGYYSRARALHRAARVITEDHGGKFPDTWEAARNLPGVGPYTAAAVLSIAYGRPHAAVDGNVIRVLSRLRRLDRPDLRSEPHASLAAALLDRHRAGDWNQAVMELGETICLPKTPTCPLCPIARFCASHEAGDVHLFPPPKLRRSTERVRLRLLLIRDRRRRLLLERGAFRFLSHLWLPPIEEIAAEDSVERPLGSFQHAILHRQFEVVVVKASATGLKKPTGETERRYFSDEEITSIGRSALLTKALKFG